MVGIRPNDDIPAPQRAEIRRAAPVIATRPAHHDRSLTKGLLQRIRFLLAHHDDDVFSRFRASRSAR